jgi:Zn-dependent peptidase ImmA (M78 family)
MFRSTTDLQQGQKGIGEWVRPVLRRLGILVVESPINSTVEGCTFTVGSEEAQTPCVFANSYRSTWFRRNEIILHEVAHAIFDLENDPVALDFKNASAASEISEIRAQKFAQECLVPRSVLVHAENRLGLKWTELSPENVADLVTSTHAEQALVLKAALDNSLIDEDLLRTYLAYDCRSLIRQSSPHALTTREYLRTLANQSPKWIAENRNTSVGQRPLRLPSNYVAEVIDTYDQGEISMGKAAEMLMMDKEAFRDRFSPVLQAAE